MNASSNPDEGGESVRVKLALQVPGGRLDAKITVSTCPTAVRELVPMAQVLADQIIAYSIGEAEAEGHTVSCRAGCGACCRQLVPIGEAEARHLRDLVENLPEPRRSQIQQRFADAVRTVAEAGLLDALNGPDMADLDRRREVGLEYFRLGLPCPFLENESCSIHPDRPISCREYLVTTPAAYCSAPSNQITCLPVVPSIWTALARCDPPPPGSTTIRWLPLILALDWTASHPDEPPTRSGLQLLQDFMDQIGRRREGLLDEGPETEEGQDE